MRKKKKNLAVFKYKIFMSFLFLIKFQSFLMENDKIKDNDKFLSTHNG